MAVDFDALVHQPLQDIFGRPVTFRPIVSQPGAPNVQISGIFDRHHQVVLDEIAANEMAAAGHSTTAPVLTIRLSALAVPPAQDDEVTIGSETFLVWDIQPDGEGDADLVLRQKVDA